MTKTQVTIEEMKQNIIEFCEANGFTIPPQQGNFALPSMDEIADALVNDTATVHEDYTIRRLILHIPSEHRGSGKTMLMKCGFCIREEQRAHADPDSLRYRGSQA